MEEVERGRRRVKRREEEGERRIGEVERGRRRVKRRRGGGKEDWRRSRGAEGGRGEEELAVIDISEPTRLR